MTENEFNSLHEQIMIEKQKLSIDEFFDSFYKVSCSQNPNGIFYSMKERLEYEQLLEQTNDKDIKQI
jgi:hypothetical protein